MSSGEPSRAAATPDGTARGFDEYLKEEYRHIAEAHFRTIEAISSFFRYYLLIMSLPASVIVVGLSFMGTDSAWGRLSDASWPWSSLCLAVVAFLGFFVMLFVANLRMDVVLYARTVNGIRKYFYDRADVDLDTRNRTRVLPQTPFQPGYAEFRYFGPVVATFGLFNTAYLALAVAVWMSRATLPPGETTGWTMVSLPWGDTPRWVVWAVACAAFLAAHGLCYWLMSCHREHGYLKSYAIGVDIDGVLNRHRDQFCQVLQETTGKSLLPEDIVVIPIHEHPQLGVGRSDEIAVFNRPSYWTMMPEVDDACSRLRAMRNGLSLKVYIFTSRPWPDLTVAAKGVGKRGLADEWRTAAAETVGGSVWRFRRKMTSLRMGIGLLQGVAPIRHGVARFLRPLDLLRLRLGRSPLDVITESWLRARAFEYDGLMVERGSENVADPRGHVHNRFFVARKRGLKFFVEDDWEKACKLAYICDVVLLFDQPYNRPDRTLGRPQASLPSNVIRVHSWDELYRQVRRLA